MSRWSLIAALLLVGCNGRAVLTVGDGGSTDGRTIAPSDARTLDQRPNQLPPDARRPTDSWVDPHKPDLPKGTPCTDGWCRIPAGTFLMGSPAWEACRNWSTHLLETQHQVTLTRGFLMAATEVTQGQFDALIGQSPSFYGSCGSSCPVELVTWSDAARYCNALSAVNGLPQCYLCTWDGCDTPTSYDGSAIYDCPGYRLPTEAEWEYAYRAGTETPFYSGSNPVCQGANPHASVIGWYDMNSNQRTHEVAQKQPNAWGLFDMAGNVAEWTHDPCNDELGPSPASDPLPVADRPGNVVRGGSWFSFARELRAAYRNCGVGESYLTGFRCVRSLIP